MVLVFLTFICLVFWNKGLLEWLYSLTRCLLNRYLLRVLGLQARFKCLTIFFAIHPFWHLRFSISIFWQEVNWYLWMVLGLVDFLFRLREEIIPGLTLAFLTHLYTVERWILKFFCGKSCFTSSLICKNNIFWFHPHIQQFTSVANVVSLYDFVAGFW